MMGFWLARALEKNPGIKLVAAVQMGNHIHLVLRDDDAELAKLMEYFLGKLAVSINALDQVTGQVFERRYAATEILDADAVVERIAYTVTNPVAAHLVAQPEDWDGLCAWGDARARSSRRRFSKVRQTEYRRALRRAEGRDIKVDVADYTCHATLNLSAPTGIDPAKIEDAIRQRVQTIEANRTGGVLGMRKARAVDPFDAPKNPKRSPMPLCHATDKEAWSAYRDMFRAFTDAYREASRRFRAGMLTVVFPSHAFPPSLPLYA